MKGTGKLSLSWLASWLRECFICTAGIGKKWSCAWRPVILVLSCLVLLSGCSHHLTGILNPKGIIAKQEQTLMMDSVALMLIVVIPVIIMSFAFAFRYRASKRNNKSKYRPNWSHSVFLEAIWWGVPCIIIIILGVMTWVSSHKLDPYRRLQVPGKILRIEAVSLQWKWLFIYPKQNIATVNYMVMPKDTQVAIWITSDAPMSAFFIPQLGSQIYSMAGMRTRLHLYSQHEGVYQGLNTQYNGDGFSDMHFKAKVTDAKGFKRWVEQVKRSKHKLSIKAYQHLVKPSEADPVVYYGAVRPHLFERIMMQYTKPNMRLH